MYRSNRPGAAWICWADYEVLDDADAAHYLEVARSNGDALRTEEGVRGPEIPAPADAIAGEWLLAFLGRKPR